MEAKKQEQYFELYGKTINFLLLTHNLCVSVRESAAT